MRALSVRQPWASLIVAGIKDVENRDWAVGHRGPLAIHASLAPAPPADWAHANRVLESLRIHWSHVLSEELAYGAVVGTVELVDVRQGHDSPWTMETAFQWLLSGAEPFTEPIPWQGKLGLWGLPESVVPLRPVG